MWFQGTLVVKAITGRNGPFTVAKLHLDVGVFAVKHPLIQQLDEGRYPVTADVESFFIATRPANGASISELAAWTKDIQIQSDDAAEAGDIADPLMVAGLVEDPDDVSLPPGVSKEAEHLPEEKSSDGIEEEGQATADDEADDEINKLFGDMAAAVIARQPVKLDPAAGALMRAQVAYLKTHGYKFKSTEKIWLDMTE